MDPDNPSVQNRPDNGQLSRKSFSLWAAAELGKAAGTGVVGGVKEWGEAAGGGRGDILRLNYSPDVFSAGAEPGEGRREALATHGPLVATRLELRSSGVSKEVPDDRPCARVSGRLLDVATVTAEPGDGRLSCRE